MDKYKLNGGKKQEKKARFNDVRFVNYELTKEEKQSCKAWLPTLDEFDDCCLKFVEGGYRYSVKWDDYTQSFACFAQSDGSRPDNSGLLLTGRGSTPSKAVKQAMFKHFVVFDLDWGGWAERGSPEELDD